MTTKISKAIDERTIVQARRRESGLDVRLSQRWESASGHVHEAQIFLSADAVPRLIAALEESLAYFEHERVKAADPPPPADVAPGMTFNPKTEESPQ